MLTITLDEAQTRFADLVKQALNGESFVIADKEKPLVKIFPYDNAAANKRLDFMRGRCVVPEDIKAVGRDEIMDMFEGRG